MREGEEAVKKVWVGIKARREETGGRVGDRTSGAVGARWGESWGNGEGGRRKEGGGEVVGTENRLRVI